MVRFNQTALERESSQTNVSLLSAATEPAHPSSPNMLLNGIIGIVLGTIAAIASVLIVEGRNRTVRSGADLVQAFGLPIVGVLPRPHHPWSGRSEQPLLVKRVLGQLPKPDSRRA
jgi:capsular polysaccharide biosynthesis protein